MVLSGLRGIKMCDESNIPPEEYREVLILLKKEIDKTNLKEINMLFNMNDDEKRNLINGLKK